MDGFKTKYHSVEKLLLCANFWTDSFILCFSLIKARKNGGEPYIGQRPLEQRH